jgi:hypothetical protein
VSRSLHVADDLVDSLNVDHPGTEYNVRVASRCYKVRPGLLMLVVSRRPS